MRTETPVQIKLSDYAPYPFAIDQVEMVFDLAPAATKVHTKMAVRRLSEGPLQLDGGATETGRNQAQWCETARRFL